MAARKKSAAASAKKKVRRTAAPGASGAGRKPPGRKPPKKSPAKRPASISSSPKTSSRTTRSVPGSPLTEAPAAQIAVVGVGASAGGLEAFTELLENLPGDTGMAFVLVSHLGDASFLADLLSRATSMPVGQVARKTPVEPNHVYVIPPLKYLTIRDGVLTSRPLRSERRPVMVIDHFLLSLAEDQKDRAIGVILSGTGSDGKLGLAAIRGQGGLAFVQDPASATYPDMPSHAASDEGCSDFVLPPGEIAKEIGRIARHPSLAADDAAASEAGEAGDLDELLGLVERATGLDFREYKPATLRRRIARRMLLGNFPTLTDYARHLRSDPGEVDALHRDILINVTGFLRDPGTFDFLSRDVLPRILERQDYPVRVWVPGCATGEEAYSIAILLSEAMGKSGSGPRVQIFATDVSEGSIRKAREGIYGPNVADDVSPARLRRFFAKLNGFYQVNQNIRDMCVFAVQNVVRDPPFSRMDLVSCRNLLIYLGTRMQQRALATFHYALKPGGYLLLGASETVGTSNLFRQIDKKHRVFVKQDIGSLPALKFESRGPLIRSGRHLRPPRTGPDKPDMGREIDRLLVDRWGPPGVLLDSRFEIVQFRGNTGLFLEPAPGRASLNVLHMARRALSAELRAALEEARSGGAAVSREGVRLDEGGGGLMVGFEIVPLGEPRFRERHYLVVFQAGPERASLAGKPSRRKGQRPAPGNETKALEQELESTQSDLRAVIDELEHRNEDLQSANEEILSANEELQSTNEELETAKEELQATNEELTTVNEELKNRNVEMDQANSDLVNLLGSVDVVILMIGSDLSIRRYTPNAQKVMRLIPTDLGRPLTDVKSQLEVQDLEGIIRRVIRTGSVEEAEVRDDEKRWYAMRVRPYRTAADHVDGAVVTLVDITGIRQSREEAEGALRMLLEDVPDFILGVEPLGQVLFLNRTRASLAREAETGENFLDYLVPKERPAARRCLEKVARTGARAEFRTRAMAGPGEGSEVLTRVHAVKKEGAVRALAVKTGGGIA